MSQIVEKALPGIDQEYDQPDIKEMIDRLVEDEAATTPADLRTTNLLKERFPHLWSDEELRQRDARVKERAAVGEPKLDLKFTIIPPESAEETSITAWEQSVAHAKAQYVYQENQLLSLELLDEHSSTDFLRYNYALESISKFYSDHNQQASRQLHEVQKQRHSLQVKTYPQLAKYVNRKAQACHNRFQCDYAYEQMRQLLLQKGFDYEGHVLEQAAAAKADVNDPSVNNTVKQYLSVNITSETESTSDATTNDNCKHKDESNKRRRVK